VLKPTNSSGIKNDWRLLMVNWTQAKEDPYYRARQFEEEARRTGTVEAWQEFAALKEGKGSYVLACYGFFSAALACERAGDINQAFSLYAHAFQNARRSRSKELAVMTAYRHALLAERAELWEACIEIYESLGSFAEELGNHFTAADAYEHAAEIKVKTGQSAADYVKPIEQWEKNAAYWRKQGHEDDAAWSERHIALYKTLFGTQAK
jgi:tetratricopeptide (TPR) repeat protein